MVDTRPSADLLRDNSRLPRLPEPNATIIFGASGDLTARKLIPALYDLTEGRRLPMEFAVVGVSRTALSHEVYRKKLRDTLDRQRPGGISNDIWDSFSSNVFYLPGDSKNPETYRELNSFLERLDQERGRVGTGPSICRHRPRSSRR